MKIVAIDCNSPRIVPGTRGDRTVSIAVARFEHVTFERANDGIMMSGRGETSLVPWAALEQVFYAPAAEPAKGSK